MWLWSGSTTRHLAGPVPTETDPAGKICLDKNRSQHKQDYRINTAAFLKSVDYKAHAIIEASAVTRVTKNGITEYVEVKGEPILEEAQKVKEHTISDQFALSWS